MGGTRAWRILGIILVVGTLFHYGPPGVPATLVPGGSATALAEESEPGEEADELRERIEWFYGQRAAPFAAIPDGAVLKARAQAAAFPDSGTSQRAKAALTTESPWTAIGPRPIALGVNGFANGSLPNSGRVTAVAAVDANTVYIGTADGGVWKTTDGGANWTPLTDNQASLAIGALTVDPTNPNIIYAGTGEANNNADAYTGVGVLKSVNGGATWTLSNPAIFNRAAIARIAVDPNNPQIVYAAASVAQSPFTAGIAKSTDGGVTWTRASLGGICCGPSDVVIDATTNPSTVYASQGFDFGDTSNGVYKTTTDLTNSSANWTKLPGTGANTFPTTDVGRIRLTITRQAPTTMYAIVHRPSNDGLLGVWKTTDGGANWVQTAHPETSSGATSFSVCSQCFYDLNIAVFPTNPNIVYALAIELFRSTDGGATWSLISNAYTQPFKIHADQHGFDFVPGNQNAFYLGNDGGAYKSTDGGASFTNLNQTLSLSQFYRGAAHPTNITSAIGGAQDDGALSYENALGWFRSLGGDGAYVAVDFNNPNNVYMSTQNLNIFRSTTGPRGTFAAANSGIPNEQQENRQFIAPIAMDPTNPQVLYAGTTKLYRTANGASSWTATNGQDLSGAGTSRTSISAIAVAPSNPATIYVGTGSSSAGASKFWVTTDTGTTFTNRTTGLPNRFMTSIAVHPTNSQTAWVTVSGFDTGHVWKTTNSGQTWTDSSGTLPNAPANAVVVDPADPNQVYVGTDVGVFKSVDGGTSWLAMNTGLPNVGIMDLVLNRAGTRLFAFSHGRGAFVADRTTVGGPTSTPTPTGATATPTPTLTVPVGPVPNDDFNNATVIPSLPFNVVESTTQATTAGDDPQSCGSQVTPTDSNSVWFRFTAPSAGTLTLSTAGSSYDTVLSVWTGQRGSLNLVACNDDAVPGSLLTSLVNFPASGGTTYSIEVTEFGSPGGGSLNFTATGSFGGVTSTLTPTPTQPGAATLTPTPTRTSTATPTRTPTFTPTSTATQQVGSGVAGRNLAIGADNNNVQLTWEAGNASGFAIARLANGNLSFPYATVPAGTTTFTDFAAPAGLDCYAVFPNGTGTQSDIMCAQVGFGQLNGAPQTFRASLKQTSNATLTWQPPLGGGQTSFLVYSQLSGFFTFDQFTNSTVLPTSGLVCFAVGTLNNSGLAGYTNLLCGLSGFTNIQPGQAERGQAQASIPTPTGGVSGNRR